MIDWLFSRGHAVDMVLLVMLAELAALTAFRGWPFMTALFRLLPGVLMMLALRAALTGSDWRWIALPLAMSFPVHLADLRRRG